MDKLDPARCAVLALDFTPVVVENYAADAGVADTAASLCRAARAAGALNIYVIPGPANKDGPSAFAGGLHPAFEATEGEFLLHKPKVCSFASTSLDLILRESGRDRLIICGVAISGTVLSTVRSAYDRGFQVTLAEDACSDPEPEVHRALTQRIHEKSWIGLWRFAEISTVAEIYRRLV